MFTRVLLREYFVTLTTESYILADISSYKGRIEHSLNANRNVHLGPQ